MKKLIVLLLSFGVADSALAKNSALQARGSQQFDSQITLNPDGPYLGGGIGQFNLHLNGLGDIGHAFSEVFDSKNNVWKAFAGYRFNPYTSVEASYLHFGAAENGIHSEASSSQGLSPALIITIPSDVLELFGKAGYYYYGGNRNFLYGGGLGFNVGLHWNVRAEYELISISGRDTDAFWMAAAWRF